ncbi:hypothetical protein POM88_015114 [Heracleum sosnowskyi]|uniref:Uncharacterized protein n=1 Tax=Heracleum sosnowskyi TaxID=360622 RepID=A0AAD8IL72_9APIA|nr:hypothetical protein POM88_015114 [Heracleum sosnowskyi]
MILLVMVHSADYHFHQMMLYCFCDFSTREIAYANVEHHVTRRSTAVSAGMCALPTRLQLLIKLHETCLFTDGLVCEIIRGCRGSLQLDVLLVQLKLVTIYREENGKYRTESILIIRYTDSLEISNVLYQFSLLGSSGTVPERSEGTIIRQPDA